MKTLFILCFVLVSALLGAAEAKLQLVPLFRGCSYYWSGTAGQDVLPYVREGKTGKWIAGFAPVHDLEKPELRGSVVYLKEDTAYEFELRSADGKVLPDGRGTFRTLGAPVPVAKTIVLDEKILTVI